MKNGIFATKNTNDKNVSMKTIYECSQSKGIKWVTAIFFVLMFLAILAVIYKVSNGLGVTTALVVAGLLIVSSVSCFLVFPMYVIADEEGIGIRTLLRTKRISYESIDHIERVGERNSLFGFTSAVRLFGIGGVFGYIGWFSSKGVGTFQAYVTDSKKVFLIYRKKGRPIAISVSEPDEFLPYYLKGGEQ